MERILLFYKYVDIEWPEAITKWQKQICSELNLKGRIIVATEGINGTIAGTIESLQRYTDYMNQHPLFGNIDFKTSEGDRTVFPRMRIIIKKEIVNYGIDPATLKASDGGIHLSPQEAHDLITESPSDLIIVDIRNKYESRIGAFRNAIKPDVKTSREIPAFIDNNLALFKDKQVLMECTGGVRCERMTAYLKQKKVTKAVYQIKGGIHRYAEQFPDGHFRGSNYVFDARVTQRINDDILSTCDLCPTPCDYYHNCLNASCNKHYLVCPPCLKQYDYACSTACQQLLETGAAAPREKMVRHDDPLSRNNHTIPSITQ